MYEKGIKGWFKHFDFVVLDLICLQIAFWLSYIIYNGGGNPYANPLYRNMAVTVVFLDIIIIFFQETFKNVLKRGYYREFAVTVKQAIFVLMLSTLYLFAMQVGHQYSRITLVLMVGIYAVLTYAVRLLWKKQLLKRIKNGGERSLLIITDRRVAEKVVENIRENSFFRFKMTGLIILDQDMVGQKISNVPVVSNIQNASNYIGKEWVDEVLIASTPDVKCPDKLLNEIMEMGVTVHQYLARTVENVGRKQFVETIGKYTVLTTSINTMTMKQAFMKRALDIVGGLAGCILTGIIFVFIAPIIYISSPGPIFFSQTRIGKNGKPFKMYKFRSMYMDAEERKAELAKENRVKDGMMFKLDFDPRVIGNKIMPDGRKKTGIGQFIRNTSLDEFPQFANVLLGQMSLCGTRPCTMDEWEKYELHHRARMAVKPGLTGMWQVSGRSEITDFEEVVRLDREYINNWSMGLDFRILLKTVAVVFKKDGSM